jgi:predicted nucleic acid-binding protein
VIGIDTSFLVAFEVSSHPLHCHARSLAERHAGDGFALAPQVLAEFVHVVTDAHRFGKPLATGSAIERAERWWTAREVTRVFATAESTGLFLQWMTRLNLGHKRLLDTQLAARYKAAGVSLIATTRFRDFASLPGIQPLVPGA